MWERQIMIVMIKITNVNIEVAAVKPVWRQMEKKLFDNKLDDKIVTL